ncbi:hypothetical protein [Clostridioides sp. ZZV14-5902]|uniref:hypothetical protein n=1 Tax=Clostridioides sp. ZZV14-5902 TaxID=2811486 RepID=UPI001D10C433|nr:hypothetical protein [Clostridioides sp. ZZV14-5902]
MTKTNTDVPESIAGYYYQILLAIRALTKLSNDEDCIGIEKGADVRIIEKCGDKISIEAKFYKNGMNSSHKAIIHTIYNFYNNLIDDKHLIFQTNVEIQDTLLDSISNVKEIDDITDEQLAYICISLMKEYCNKNTKVQDKVIKEHFREYIELASRTTNEIKIESNILDKHYQYYYNQFTHEQTIPFWSHEIDKEKVKLLIKKIEFKGCIKQEKYESIKKLKDDISQELNKFDIREEHIKNIIKILVDMFLATTVKSDEFDTISLKDLKDKLEEIVLNDYNINLEFYNETFIQKVESLDEHFENELNNNYFGEYKNEILNRYVIIREMFLGELRANTDKFVEDILKIYAFSDATIYTLDQMVKFLTLLTIFDGVDNEEIKKISEKLGNLEIGKDTFFYKEHGFKKVNRALDQLVRETRESISDHNENSTILLSGRVGCEKLCNVDYKRSAVFDIGQVKANEALYRYYKSLKYKCDRCIDIYNDDEEGNNSIDKFKRCKGWKSWE